MTDHSLTCVEKCRTQERERRATEKLVCAGGPHQLTARRWVHTQIAIGWEAEIVDDREMCA